MFTYARKLCQAPLIGRAFLSPPKEPICLLSPQVLAKPISGASRICIADRAQLNRNHGGVWQKQASMVA